MVRFTAFKEQITRFAACHFTLSAGPTRDAYGISNAGRLRHFDVWFPPSGAGDVMAF